MPAQTLYELAKNRLIQNIHMLTDIGDLPYSFLAPVLRHIQNPSQLIELETQCPQILGETGEIWLRFIKRDIPSWDKKPHQPRDAKNWSKVYKKLKKDAEREKAEQEEQLREQMRALQKDRKGNQTMIIESKVGIKPAVKRTGFAGRSNWGAPSAPAKTGKAAFDKLRKGIFDQKQARPKATMMPAHLLQERKGTVKQLPARMERMRENEAPKRMAISRGAAATVAASTSRPTLQAASATTPEKLQRTSLPTGQHFSAPKVRTQTTTTPAVQKKRKRDEPAVFMSQKRRA